METWDNEIGIKKESYSTKHCSVVSQSTSLVREARLEKPPVSLEYMQIDSRTVASPQASIKDLSINQSRISNTSSAHARIARFSKGNMYLKNETRCRWSQILLYSHFSAGKST